MKLVQVSTSIASLDQYHDREGVHESFIVHLLKLYPLVHKSSRNEFAAIDGLRIESTIPLFYLIIRRGMVDKYSLRMLCLCSVCFSVATGKTQH